MAGGTNAADVPLIKVEGLKKRYGPKWVLEDVSLSVAKGEVVVVLGPNGSGKSTLLRCINMLEPYQHGLVRLKGQVISEGRPDGHRPSRDERAAARLVRRRVGMVFQQFNLFPHMTVLDNVAIGPRKVLGMPREQARAVAETMLRKVGLWEKHPGGPTTLSGGQQQRAAIARALAMSPEVMLFDEPTSSLDPLMTREVLRVIRQLAADGMTMLLVTHDLDAARTIAQRVIFIEAGRVSAQGTPQNIFEERPTAGLRRFMEAFSG